MRLKSQLNRNKFFLILAQIAILGMSMAAIFWLMALSNEERIENDLKARLDASTQAMAAQLKANQVPFSATNVEPGVFIINQTDGTMVIDRRNNGDAGQKLWEGYKTKIIYEMQKQKRGWAQYPDQSTWNFNAPKRIIRYVSIDELNWILAVEDQQPSPWDLLKESVNPSTCLTIFFIFILGAIALGLMNMRYFELIRRQISDSLEDNILSMGGEEKLWGKSHGQIPKTNEMKAAPPVLPVAVDDPIMEEIFHKPPMEKAVSPVTQTANPPIKVKPKEKTIDKPIVKTEGKLKETIKASPARAVENNDMSVDVQHIHSPALKKILQEFRKK